MSAAALANQAAVFQRRPVKTALHQAVLDHRLHQVRLIVAKHGGNVDSQDMYGRTPLMLACLLDNELDGYRMVRIFLEAGAYIHVKDGMNRTALHYACMKGREKMVRKLLNSDTVEVNTHDNDGNTPLMYAALCGNPVTVKLMCDVMKSFSVTADDRNGMGYTALLLACKYGHFVSAHILITTAEASPALRDNEFFFNALDWTRKSANLCAAYTRQKTHSFSEMPRFSRENTMYGQFQSPACRHVKAPSHPLGQSLDRALRLPAIFQPGNADHAEKILDGNDAREVLVKEITELLNSPKYRPPSRNVSPVRRVYTKSGNYRSRKYPATAKLRALIPVNRQVKPDIRDLLDMYSDQCIDNHMSFRHAQSAPSGSGE